MLTRIAIAALLSPLTVALPVSAATAPTWNVTGSYTIAFNYLGTDYTHDATLSQDATGTLSGTGASPSGGPPVYTWTITGGTAAGDTIDFLANYTASADAVTPQTTMHVLGTVATDGTLSGTWSDNYQGGTRTGIWKSTVGTAKKLSAEDFGVVSYDTGLGMLKGYSAGFGLTNATFTNTQSVVMKLYSGTTLLQTNTATAKVGIDILGSQISTPFDVSGAFAYGTDGYWVNVREAEYGQTLPATSVTATVTLENGTVVTAQNAMLTGDPATIFPATTTPPVATSTVTVTINKFIDGAMATAPSANSAAFPMTATWNATNTGAGTGTYTLSTVGFNTPLAYQAVTAAMSSGASYSTSEVTGGALVGTTCTTGQAYTLVGYTTGATLAEAEATTTTLTAPSFTNLTNDRVVIVWNKLCVPTPVHLSPANNSTTTTAAFTSADWSDVTDATGSMTYIYQVSNASSTNLDGSFVTPIYTSPALASSSIATTGTPDGTYYWHVMAIDADGNVSAWSTAWKITVNNTVVATPPVTPTTKDQCKNNGWRTFTKPTFKNQGQCIDFVEHAKDNHEKDHKNEHENNNEHKNDNHGTTTSSHETHEKGDVKNSGTKK